MEIDVNGERQTMVYPLTVAELLCELAIDPNTVIVERNMKILKREDHGAQSLAEGDVLEIIQMVSGG